jgi:hypothetical protein
MGKGHEKQRPAGLLLEQVNYVCHNKSFRACSQQTDDNSLDKREQKVYFHAVAS